MKRSKFVLSTLLVSAALIGLQPKPAGSPIAASTVSYEQTDMSKAIVVFTGDEQRVAEGLKLYMEGRAARLLISGIEIANVDLPAYARKLGVEITRDLSGISTDPLSRDTHGNARNTALWAKQHDITGIILVTSDYHMPRSWFLLRGRPEIRHVGITAHAVPSGAPHELFLLERRKLLAARMGLTTRDQYRFLSTAKIS